MEAVPEKAAPESPHTRAASLAPEKAQAAETSPGGMPIPSADRPTRRLSLSESAATEKTGFIPPAQFQPRLLVREMGWSEREILLADQPLIIGRDPKAHIPIGLPTSANPVGLPDISRRHAQVVPCEGGYAIVDLDSRNGTHLRGRRLAAERPERLQHGDIIRIGDTHGNSVSLTYLDQPGPPMPLAAVAISQAQLATLPVITIGRHPQNTIPLESLLVSRQHAQIVRTPGGHELVDLGSVNGTYLNGRRVRRAPLKPGDVIQIGHYRLLYSPEGIHQASLLGSVRLDALDLHKQVPAHRGVRVLLDGVSLTILPREFVAIVGGSGAGKTTLIDALNGSRRAQRGQVLLNGDDLYRNFDVYRGSFGYVPQADILHTALRVRDALAYTARLRLPPDTKPAEIQSRIDEVLQMVDMTAQRDVPIAKLSGGQRKRVSIASEMLSDPSLLFLDEPTSGLDPGLDKKMMRTLNDLADSGRTVVLTTHATANIEVCDHVAFLSHGRLVYYGPPRQAMAFFEASDFATIYSKVEKPQQAQEAAARFRRSPDYRQWVADRQSDIAQLSSQAAKRRRAQTFSPLAWLRQYLLLSQRYVHLILNDRLSLFVLSAVMPIIGLFLLLITRPSALVGDATEVIEAILKAERYYQVAGDAQKLLLMMALSVFLLGVFAAAYEIAKERPIFERERLINLRILPYLASKLTVLVGFGSLQVVALMLVVASKVRLPWQGVLLPAPLEMFVTLLLALLSGVTLGLLISAVVRHTSPIIYIILVILFTQIIFSGVLFPLPPLVEPLSYLSPTRWTMEALGASVNLNALNALTQTLLGISVKVRVSSPLEFTVNYSSTLLHLFVAWLTQGVFAGVFACGAACVLKAQDVG